MEDLCKTPASSGLEARPIQRCDDESRYSLHLALQGDLGAAIVMAGKDVLLGDGGALRSALLAVVLPGLSDLGLHLPSPTALPFAAAFELELAFTPASANQCARVHSSTKPG